MSTSVLLQPPVGRMPVAARWYLAGVCILALVLLAVHFALQVTAQRQVSGLAHAWAAKSGASLKSVRLRMLRGAMTIEGLHWQGQNGVAVTLPFLLLRGHFTTSTSTSHITEALFHGADIRLPAGFRAIPSTLPGWLVPLLNTVRKVDGNGELQLEGGSGLFRQPLYLRHLHYSLRGRGEARKWAIEAGVFDGHLRIEGNRQGQQYHFDGLNAEQVEEALGLASVPGRLTGIWQRHGGIQRGELELRMPESDEPARLAWHGDEAGDQWQFDVHSHHWPLTMAAPFIPGRDGERLAAGTLEAALHLQVDRKGWRAQMADGEVSGLTFMSAGPAARQTGLYMRTLHLVDAGLEWPQRHLQAARMEIEDASLALALDASSPLPGWHLECGDIAIGRLRPGIQAGDAMFWLPDLSGRAQLSDGGGMAFALATIIDKGEGEWWRLQGSGKSRQGKHWQAEVQIEAEDVPLVRMRPLFGGRLEHGREMNGDIAWRGTWRLDRGGKGAPWHLAADITGRNLSMLLDGKRWGTERLEAKLIQAAPKQTPHFGRIVAADWFCQLALQPMTVAEVALPSQEYPFWLGEWQVDALELHRGTVSVGNPEAHWLTNAEVLLEPIIPGRQIAVRLKGGLGEGGFEMVGEWSPWGAVPHFGGRATLRHALPFILRDWMQLSGMPRLTRGRISAGLELKDQGPLYTGNLDIELAHAALEGGAFAADPLPDHIGFRTVDLFERLGASDRAVLRVPLSGRWSEKPLGWHALGEAVMQAMRQKVEATPLKEPRQQQSQSLTHIRLYQKQGLRHNERVRLRQAIAYLKKHRRKVVELLPQLGGLPLDDALVERVRRTQREIEQFMVERGIKTGRIMPVWPAEVQRSSDAVGIRIQAVM